MIKKRFFHDITDCTTIIFGSLIYAVAVSCFTAPNNIAQGGLTGVSIMLNFVFNTPIGITTMIMNIPLLIWGLIENGKSYLAKTVVAIVVSSVAIDVISSFTTGYHGEKLLAAMFGGILSGCGLGLIFYRGGSTGGVDIVAQNIHKHLPFFSVGKLILLADALIIFATIPVYGGIESAMYTSISIFLSVKVIDMVTKGFARDNGKLMFIITSKYAEITKEIIENVERSVTVIDGKGGYTGDDKKVVLCALRPRQVYKVRRIAEDIDRMSFIVVTDAENIMGKGFRNR